jgi:hypothetical protein
MTGAEYWIRKQRRTIMSLQQETQRSAQVIYDLKNDTEHKKCMSHYIALSQALGVPVSALMATYPDDSLGPGDHPVHKCKHTTARNCVAQYRLDKNLTFLQLSVLLGVTTMQGARRNCICDHPSKRSVEILSALEGLTPQEFREKYAPAKARQ